MNNENIFLKCARTQIPRILGLLNRDKNSKTFGCFDRNYWHYKIIDFPNARFQETVLLIALIYKNNFENNKFFKNRQILDWAAGAISFWGKIQNKDGSFNEVYPFERSFCATSFSTYSITEFIITLGEDIDSQLYNKPIIKAGEWLIKNDNADVANQTAGAALALYNIFLITKDDKYKLGSQKKIELLLNQEKKFGFFPEYGGFDVGYISLTLSCLSLIYEKNAENKIKEAAISQTNKLDRLIDENGSFDFSSTSRKTQYLYPLGFLFFGKNILRKIRNGVENDLIPNPIWLDDRYTVSLTTNYFQTFLKEKEINT